MVKTKGFYIVFEGIVGTGKSTQSKKLAQYLQGKFPKRKVVWTREPGGTEIADAVRKLAQATKFEEEMDPICEAYLYAASRAQALRKLVQPILAEGGIVVSDRSFITSLAYQGFGRGLGIDKVLAINQIAIEAYNPNLIIFLALEPGISLGRSFDKEGDKWESQTEAFFQKAIRGYKKISRMARFKKIWLEVKAGTSIEEVFGLIIKKIGH